MTTAETMPVTTEMLIESTKTFLDTFGWTSVALARSIGVSPATISQFLSGKYPGDIEAVKTKVLNLIARETEKKQLKRSKSTFVETTVSKRFFDVARATHMYTDIGVLYGSAGLGKTISAREYARRHPDTILIEVDPGYTNRYFLTKLHARLGLQVSQKHNPYLLEDIIEKLAGSGRLLIIDEAEQLRYEILETVRRIYDKAEIGILLAGMHKLLNNLRGVKDQYAQLFSRVGMAAKLEALTEKDTKTIVANVIGNDYAWDTFHTESSGNTRRLYKLMARATLIAQMNECEIDQDVVQKASELVRIERMS